MVAYGAEGRGALLIAHGVRFGVNAAALLRITNVLDKSKVV